MKRYSTALALAACVGLPGSARAQGAGIGGRAGTLGLGGEAAIGVTERVVFRGGAGVSLLEPKATFDDIEVTLTIPTWYNVGVDFYLNGAVRVGGGVLFKGHDLEFSGDVSSPQEIGGSTFTPQQLGTLTGVIDSSDRAPYVLVGFGRHVSPGLGLFLDLGAAFLGDPHVRLGARGGTLSDQDEPLRSALDREAADFEKDRPTYVEFWPILSLGIRVGLG